MLDHIGEAFKAYSIRHNRWDYSMKSEHIEGVEERSWTQQEVDDFLQGGIDCRKGIPHQDKSEFYNRGYGAQYELQEVLSARTNKST